MKYVFCAQCGEKLEVHRKAVPKMQKIFDIIRPHNCGEVTLDDMSEEAIDKIVENDAKPASSKLDKMFEGFEFIKKLNNLKSKTSPINVETRDKRDKETLRKELSTSSAPPSLFSHIKSSPNSQPENDVTKEPEGD